MVTYFNLISFGILVLWTCQLTAIQAAVLRRRPIVQPLNSSTKLVEGDILPNKVSLLDKWKNFVYHANAKTQKYLWPNGVIPYVIDSSVEQQYHCLIRAGMLHIMLQSCIDFYPTENANKHRHYVNITKDEGYCYSMVGIDSNHAERPLSLGDGCYDIGTVIHELMHAIGFHHEHKRSDRDGFVKIHFENLKQFNDTNFELNSPYDEQLLTKFDIDSIMMYGSRAFSYNGDSITIESLIPNKTPSDPYEKTGLSPLDIEAINILYKCSRKENDVCGKFMESLDFMQTCEAEALKYLNMDLVIGLFEKCQETGFEFELD